MIGQPAPTPACLPIWTPIWATVEVSGSNATHSSWTAKLSRSLIVLGSEKESDSDPKAASTSLMLGSTTSAVSRSSRSAPVGSSPIVIGIAVALVSPLISSVVPAVITVAGWRSCCALQGWLAPLIVNAPSTNQGTPGIASSAVFGAV